MTLDPYKTLKVSRDAPSEVIRAAYKVLASKYHPDRNPGDEASARMMQNINDAYSLLSDPLRRNEYDRNSTAKKSSSESDQSNGGSKSVIIHCRNCSRMLRVAEHVLSMPQRYTIKCLWCQKNPFTEVDLSENRAQEASKSIIKCQYCNQSIRVLSAAVRQPERFDVVCPKCNLNPIPKTRGDKYKQPSESFNRSYHASPPETLKSRSLKFFAFLKEISKIIKSGIEILIKYAAIAFFICILIWLIPVIFGMFSKDSLKNAEYRSSNIEKTATPQAKPKFSQPIQPLPQTGYSTSSFYDGVAPLAIKTSSNGGYHYFVKIVNVDSHQEMGSYFIRSGEVLEMKIPLGTYEVKYASGKQWYGTGFLFGPETRYSKADSLFTFSFDGYEYSGYTIELIMQRNGNLRTSGIQPNQW